MLGGLPFFVRIFKLAQARGTRKILLNVTDFSVIERHQVAQEIVAWLAKHAFVPAMGVVTAPHSGVGLGALMANWLGVNVRVFFRQSEALAWLRKQPKAPRRRRH